MSAKPYDHTELRVACPKCRVKAGDLCITKRSRKLYDIGHYHAARSALAKANKEFLSSEPEGR